MFWVDAAGEIANAPVQRQRSPNSPKEQLTNCSINSSGGHEQLRCTVHDTQHGISIGFFGLPNLYETIRNVLRLLIFRQAYGQVQ